MPNMKISDKFYYGWVIVIAGLIISAVLIGSRQSFSVFFKSIESDFGLNRAVTSGIFSAFMAFSALSSALGGWALDRFGPKITIAAMGFFAGFSLLITSQVHSVWLLYLTYSLIMSLGTGGAYTVAVGFISRWFQKKRGLALGISSTGGGLGSLIFAPFASYLIISFDWRVAYIVIGIIALVVVISLSLLLKGYPREMGLFPDGSKREIAEIDVSAKNDPIQARFSLKDAMKTRQFWLLFMTWAFYGTSIYIISTHIVPHATDLGISELVAATIISVLSIFNIIGGLMVGTLSDKFGRKTVSIVSTLIGVASLFLLMWVPNNIWVLYIFAALFGIPFGGIGTIVSALAADIFGTRSIGRIIGVIGIAWFIGAAIGPVVGGVIFDAFKNYFLAFAIAALTMLIAILFLALLSKPKVNAMPDTIKD
jgi:OFA family oxalate/formate antiporter-like MFS transporter